MAAIPDAPHIRILEAVKATLVAVDFLDLAGMHGDKPLTIRHFNKRHARSDEKPCLSIRWVGRGDNETDADYKSGEERPMQCQADLIIDLDPVDEDNTDTPDATGWGELSRVAAVALQALRDPDECARPVPGSPLDGMCDYVSDVDLEPDEDSKPDNGRLVQTINVVYRIRTTNSNVLLAPGAI